MMKEETLLIRRWNGQTLAYVQGERGQSEHHPTATSTHHRIIVIRKGWSSLDIFLLALQLLLLSFLLMSLTAAGIDTSEMEILEFRLLRPSGSFVPSMVAVGALIVLYSARRHRVVEEAVVVMPSLGVQLETVYYNRKRVHRRFVPLHKILAPVINEAVTPVTCYFYLALLLRDEDSLTLAFLSLRPPLEMLVHIWKSLCNALGISTAPRLLGSREEGELGTTAESGTDT